MNGLEVLKEVKRVAWRNVRRAPYVGAGAAPVKLSVSANHGPKVSQAKRAKYVRLYCDSNRWL